MNDTWLVSTRKGLFTVTGRGANATLTGAAFVGDNVSLALADPRDGAWYAALDHGHFGAKLHRSDDRGATWTEIAAPAYPPKPDDVVDNDAWGKPIPWSTRLIWSLEIAPDADGALWCGTIPGGLFRSDDRGASWRLIDSLWHHPARKRWMGGGADLPGLHSICVDPRDPRTLVVAVSCGGVWRSRDLGATWTSAAAGMRSDFMPPEQQGDAEIQDPHAVVQSAGTPTAFWSQHHCGIFRSDDDLASWHAITAPPSSFGFTVAVHPRDGAIAWFVPALSDQKRAPVEGQVVVTRTRDGGKSFVVLRDGLPQEYAYDLCFRHALAISGDGEALAFGSTTGSLFVTADQGDHWHAVGRHLPPIYAVRHAG